MSCCDRLGGTVLRGVYQPFDSHVEYARVLSERYEHRPHGTPPEPTRLLRRRPRTDEPHQHDRPHHRWAEPSAGRLPARVGAAWDLDAAAPPAAQP
ncbi:hypothetical protein [Dactylosporangium darangshiense]|uniref:hypothetical protein n=1 Tax=Dactylosporangium darangshiense TaxID=579108 RepID=UPI0031E5590B